MTKLALTLTFVFAAACAAAAQKGTAEPDYYPMGFNGDTWTGVVTEVSEDTREFTLTYKKGEKEQSFVGILAKPYIVKMKDGRDHDVKMEELKGLRIRAYYIAKSQKDGSGAKVKVNQVFKIKFVPKD
jgi:hypothetical protein